MMERVRLAQPRGITILDCLDDPKIFAPFFKSPKTWQAWRSFLAALFGLLPNEAELEIFRECTGRQQPPMQAAREAYLIIGRRGGKSFVLALIGVFLACFRDYRKYLAPGERATVMVIASDRKQARTVLRYVKGLLNVPMLRQVVLHLGNEYVDLQHRVTIEVHTSSFKSIRGYTVVAALFDELAFWPTDDRSSDPDFEVLNAVRPGMATIPGALCCAPVRLCPQGRAMECASVGIWQGRRSVMFWHAPTRSMNPACRSAGR